MLIVVAAALSLAVIALVGGDDDAPGVSTPSGSAGQPGVETAEPTPEVAIATAIVTTNLRARPELTAEVVAVIPGGRDAELQGRSEDGAWAQLSYPAAEPLGGVEGWAPAGSFGVDEEALAAAPVVAAPGGLPSGGGTPIPGNTEALPDLAVTNAFLLPDGRLTVSLRNGGTAELEEQQVSLQVSSAEGEILGVLEIGPTSLAPGAVATVVTPVTVLRTGVYVLELDRPNSIEELSEFNNRFSQLLVAPTPVSAAEAAGADG